MKKQNKWNAPKVLEEDRTFQRILPAQPATANLRLIVASSATQILG